MNAASRLQLPSLVGRASLREQVAEALRAALVCGAMAPGVTYSVPALADRFGVSATPVREAMLDLVGDGMVEPVPNKGFRVLAVSESELDEVTQLRLLLKVPTVASLTGRLDAAQVAHLRDLAEDVRGYARAHDLETFVGIDRRFHLELLALAGNKRLVDLVGRLRAGSRLYGLAHLTPEQLNRSCSEHDDLLDALARGRPRRDVEEIMGRHLGHVRVLWAARPARPAAGST